MPKFENVEGVEIHRLPAIQLPQMALAHNFKWMTFTFTVKNLQRIKKIFSKTQFDVIHQQNHVFDTILSSSYFSRKVRLPLVLTVHTYAQHPNSLFDKILVGLDILARHVIIDKASVVVSPDPAVQRYVKTRHKISQSPIIPYGVEISRPLPNDILAIKHRYKLSGHQVILSLGHVNSIRNREDLIRALPMIIQKIPNIRLLIVGQLDIDMPQKLVNKLGLEKYVIFTGSVPHEQISAFFALSSLETHTVNSHYPGPGIASMEAMAAGLPVITGEIETKYNFSYLRNWENIVMVPYNNPTVTAETIMRLLLDNNLRVSIGENAKQMMAEKYSWDAVCSSYEKVYCQAIK